MWQEEEELIVQPQSQGMPGTKGQELAEEVYIPDYVMFDFGFSEATGSDGQPVVLERT